MGETASIRALGEKALLPHEEMFQKKSKLGQGGFGVVWLCERSTSRAHHSRQMPQIFALKELTSPKIYKPGASGDIREYLPLNELSIQQYLKHRTIVETYWADVRCLDPKSNEALDITAYDLAVDHKDETDQWGNSQTTLSWTPLERLAQLDQGMSAGLGAKQQFPNGIKLQMRIAMEHCDLGSLKDHLVTWEPGATVKPLSAAITKKRGGNISKLRCILLTCLDIAEGIKFMHKSRTLHGDLKPHNILLVSDSSDEKLFRAKVSDFGLSTHMKTGETQVDISQGTEAYLPLDVFSTFSITEATDVYGLGLLMWETFYGIFWFSVWDAEKRKRKARTPQQMNSYRPSCASNCPAQFSSLVHDCTRTDPSGRPSIHDVCSRLNMAIEELCS